MQSLSNTNDFTSAATDGAPIMDDAAIYAQNANAGEEMGAAMQQYTPEALQYAYQTQMGTTDANGSVTMQYPFGMVSPLLESIYILLNLVESNLLRCHSTTGPWIAPAGANGLAFASRPAVCPHVGR
jgi:hypothetical protein